MMKRLVLVVLTTALVGANMFVIKAHLALGAQPLAPGYAVGAMLGGLVAIPLVVVAISSLWRANRQGPRLLIAVNAGLALNIVGALAYLGKNAASERPRDAQLPTMSRAAWLAECVGSCR